MLIKLSFAEEPLKSITNFCLRTSFNSVQTYADQFFRMDMVTALLRATEYLLHIRLNQYFNDVWLRDGEHYFLNSCLQTEENYSSNSMLQPNCISKFNESTDLADFKIELRRLYFDEELDLYYVFEWGKGFFIKTNIAEPLYIQLLLHAKRPHLNWEQFEYSQPDRIFLESLDLEVLEKMIEEMERRSQSLPNNSGKIRTKLGDY